MGSAGPIQDTLPGVASSRVHQANEVADRYGNFFSWRMGFSLPQSRCGFVSDSIECSLKSDSFVNAGHYP